jgi:predicted DCC family thiol-disulfide oxidoreductase YuxK
MLSRFPGSLDQMDKPVVLFDGDCNLCHWLVRFIIRRDPRAHFRFASLQSPAGQQLLTTVLPHPLDKDTVVLVEQGHCYFESEAALRILRSLSGLWPLLYVGILLPRPIRDAVYRWIARNRYRWFGQPNTCLMPSPALRERFLEE